MVPCEVNDFDDVRESGTPNRFWVESVIDGQITSEGNLLRGSGSLFIRDGPVSGREVTWMISQSGRAKIAFVYLNFTVETTWTAFEVTYTASTSVVKRVPGSKSVTICISLE